MTEYCFFTPDAQALAETAGIKDKIESFAEQYKRQTYVLSSPLSKEDSTYDYPGAFVIFSSGSRPCIVDAQANKEGVEDYAEDFFDDISFLSEKFEYRQKIGRKKNWSQLFVLLNHNELALEKLKLDNPTEKRTADLITSLVIGSINDVAKINLQAEQLLDVVKSKIVLFDTDQTSFVFKNNQNKRYVIQGLAGSGKTELLLHKLKEIYSKEHQAKIAFTCYNKILAASMNSRIPEFFNFMKVERQIEWHDKLFCFHSWGSNDKPFSGMYRYICYFYDIPFGSMKAGSLDTLCAKAILDIKRQNSEADKFAFDYVFIDESQDFSESFIELCELVTASKVFVAGDVFQNIFRPIDEKASRADLLLKKCYRTDPRNLMFSHALGMGLYEQPVLRWLKTNEWPACGYNYDEQNGRAIVSRDPLRRFEDIPDAFAPTTIHQVQPTETVTGSIIHIIEHLKNRHPTLSQGDIAILFIEQKKYIYNEIAQLSAEITRCFDWDVNISFESKKGDPNKLFISNINNAKGLEFPFVICFTQELHRGRSFRNGLYTMMARSFLESHLVLGKRANSGLLDKLNSGLKWIYENGNMDLRIPSEKEIADQQDAFIYEESLTLEDRVRGYCATKYATPRLTAKLVQRVSQIIGDEEYDEEYFVSIVEAEYKRHEKL